MHKTFTWSNIAKFLILNAKVFVNQRFILFDLEDTIQAFDEEEWATR